MSPFWNKQKEPSPRGQQYALATGSSSANSKNGAEPTARPVVEVPPQPEHDERATLLAEILRTFARQLCSTLPQDADKLARKELQQHVADDLQSLLEQRDTLLDDADQETVVQMVLDEVFEVGPLTPLMQDTDISDILVNGPFQIYVEKKGQLRASNACFDDESHLVRIVQRMVSMSDRRLDESSPVVDARLPDGSRINAVLNPPAINGPLVSIRRFGSRPLTADDLLKNGTMSREMLEFTSACVRSRLNIVIAGGSGSGKTTVLNALSRFIRSTERIATIEDTAELELQQPHLAKLEARPPAPDGTGEITIRSLSKNALRMRPDRIIIGECRGAEVLEMLQAMNSGHEGSMTTLHANSPREALARMEMMVAMGGVEIPLMALRRQIASSINLIIQVGRQLGGQRRVVRISEVTGMEAETISMHDIFEYVQTGIENEASVGHFVATGIRPMCLERLRASGAELDPKLFAPPHQASPAGSTRGPHG